MTLRGAGQSTGSYAGLNLGNHVGDDAESVRLNRQYLYRHLPSTPIWLQQVHGNSIIEAPASPDSPPVADAVWTMEPNRVCAILTADCLPILLTNQSGTRVAAIHAGWRGLASGIVAAAIEIFRCEQEGLMAWLGPCIGPGAFEVGRDVLDAFTAKHPDRRACFTPHGPGKWNADLQMLACLEMQHVNKDIAIYQEKSCTYSFPERYFSHRRDGVTGRMATLIWIEPDPG